MIKRLFFRGGLGNQMFQYALYKELKERGVNVLIDTSLYKSTSMHNGFEIDRVFNLSGRVYETHSKFYNLLIRFLERFHFDCFYYHDNNILGYNTEVFTTKKILLTGYYCAEKYFEDIKDSIRTEFTFRSIDEKNKEIATEMSQCDSVSVHIRRGDFVESGMHLTGVEYYKKAMSYILKNVNSPVFYVFSDNLESASEFMKELNVPFKLVGINRGLDSYKDMFLMSQCKHNITINSTFSWWAAWLNSNKDKIVIALKNTPDWCCDGWIVMDE